MTALKSTNKFFIIIIRVPDFYPSYSIANTASKFFENVASVQNVHLCLMYHVAVKCVHKHAGFVDKITKFMDGTTQKYLTAFLQLLTVEFPDRNHITEGVIDEIYMKSTSK